MRQFNTAIKVVATTEDKIRTKGDKLTAAQKKPDNAIGLIFAQDAFNKALKDFEDTEIKLTLLVQRHAWEKGEL